MQLTAITNFLYHRASLYDFWLQQGFSKSINKKGAQ